MKLKPPGNRAIRGLAVTAATLASVAGLALAQAPAMADPSVTYLAVGGDITSDMMNGIASNLGSNLLGSFDAVTPVGPHWQISEAKTGITSSATAIAPSTCSFTLPNGTNEGISALRLSLGSTTATPSPGPTLTATNGTLVTLPGVAPQADCVDIARATSGPLLANVDPTAGKLLYIPFSMDAVTTAVGSAAGTIENAAGTGTEATPPTNLAALTGAGFTLAQLQAMYASGNDAPAAGSAGSGVCYAPTGGPDAAPTGFTCTSTVPVDLYLPPLGSGTLALFAKALAVNPSTLPPWDYLQIQPDAGATVPDWVGQPVQEHDGTAVTVDPNGIMPFSISQYIAPANGHGDRRHQAVLMPINGVQPKTAGGTLNTSFPAPFAREMYNVIAYDRVVNTGDGNYDSILNQLLVSQAPQVAVLCQLKLLIQQFGFGPLTAAPLGHTCGQIDTTSLRAYGPGTGF